MPKYVAFLRAINVGGHTVKMDHLRSLFEAIALSKVETFIASGNVIFDSRSKNTGAMERKIEQQLRAALGYEVVTFVRTISELAEVASYKPFSEAELKAPGNLLFVGFLREEPSKEAQQKMQSFVSEVEDFRVRRREVYWLRRTQVGVSEFPGARLEKSLGMPTTFRSSTTVKKIAAKYA